MSSCRPTVSNDFCWIESAWRSACWRWDHTCAPPADSPPDMARPRTSRRALGGVRQAAGLPRRLWRSKRGATEAPPSRKRGEAKKPSSFVERNTLKQAERKALCADARPCGARSSSRRDAWGRAWPSRRPPRRPASGARARSRCAPRRRMPRPRAAASSRSLPVSPPPRARACRRRRGQCARGTHGRLRLHARCQSCRRSCGVDRGRCVRVAWSAHLRGR